MKNLLPIILSLSFLFAPVQDHHLYTINYMDSTGKVMVYDEDQNLYTVSGNTYVYTDVMGYVKQPAIIYMPVHQPYTISENFIGNYSASITDAFAYITELREQGYKVTSYTYTPNLCTMYLSSDKDNRVFYITQDTMRMYISGGDTND